MRAFVSVGACPNLEPMQRAKYDGQVRPPSTTSKYDLRHLRGCGVVELMQTRVREAWKFALDRSRIEALMRSAQLHLMFPLSCEPEDRLK